MDFEKIREIMVDTLSCDGDRITMDSRLNEDLGIDSLDAVELVMALEEAYNIKIPDDEAEATPIVTVKDAIDKVAEKLAENE